ncbi:TNFAIP3-interacting protein 2 isoform X1 [Acipenser ruthenus]|uniref:TNFAIP3-interacting protein 2 isoform X1 n=2 Tax=Acipenser ruthenus TaxID=7906 RepID=UPI00145B970A|nr:TNFAIP3-interacting protein 2 isoform X1 [Acipenser ruthenus]
MSSHSSFNSTEPLIHGYNQREEMVEGIKMENAMLKTKLQSYTTLSTFYQEARLELARMNQQVSVQDNIIADLKARLARYENATVHMGEEGPMVFGPSKSLFENLCKEISKLKQQQKETERSSEQQLETMKLELQKLRKDLRDKDEEIQRMTSRPPHEKDLEILHLRGVLAEKERVQATREVLCLSLTDEAEQLRAQLSATVEVCQQLSQRLEGKQKKHPESVDEQIHREQSSKLQCADSKTIVCQLQEENKALQQKVAYVESLNAKWQKYDASREEYVKGLCQKLKVNSKQGFGSVQTNMDMMQQEILRLNRLLEEKMKECNRFSSETRKTDRERIQMLEQQVLIYKDDFKSERADRERAQSKIQDLQEDIVRLELQLRRQDSGDQAAPFRIHIGNRNLMHIETGAAEVLLGNSRDQSGANRSSSQSTQDSAAANRNSRSEHRAQTDLQCPRCLVVYNDDQATAFLKHCTECAEL